MGCFLLVVRNRRIYVTNAGEKLCRGFLIMYKVTCDIPAVHITVLHSFYE